MRTLRQPVSERKRNLAWQSDFLGEWNGHIHGIPIFTAAVKIGLALVRGLTSVRAYAAWGELRTYVHGVRKGGRPRIRAPPARGAAPHQSRVSPRAKSDSRSRSRGAAFYLHPVMHMGMHMHIRTHMGKNRANYGKIFRPRWPWEIISPWLWSKTLASGLAVLQARNSSILMRRRWPSWA